LLSPLRLTSADDALVVVIIIPVTELRLFTIKVDEELPEAVIVPFPEIVLPSSKISISIVAVLEEVIVRSPAEFLDPKISMRMFALSDPAIEILEKTFQSP